MKLRGYLVALVLWLIAGAIVIHSSNHWAVVLDDSRASVWMERVLYEKPGQRGFYVHVKIHNETSGTVGIDLRDPQYLFHVSEWGTYDTKYRTEVGESVSTSRKIDGPQEADLRDAYLKGRVSYVYPRDSFDYYVYYDSASGSRPEIDKQPGKFLILSIKGQMFFCDGTHVWGEQADDEFAISTPVTWKTLPGNAHVISR